MLTLPLEPTDDRANPAFRDAAGCAAWLGQLQLTQLQRAHGQLLAQLGEFNRYPMRGLERLHTLELLRETVAHVQADLAKKLLDRPLPLSAGEHLVFSAMIDLWQAMVTAYQRVLQAYIAGDQQLASYGALLCQRCLSYAALAVIEHLRSGYECGLWQQLHSLYAFAEQQSLHQTAVADPLDSGQWSARDSYVQTLLLCYINPLQPSQWQQLTRWLSQWSSSIAVTASCVTSKGDAPPLAVDLAGNGGLQRIGELPCRDSLRYLPMMPLSKLLRVKTILLRQGQTPAQVGLGEYPDRAACIDLLSSLHRRWCEGKVERERQPCSMPVQLCYRLEGIYAQLSGQDFKPQQLGIDPLARQQLEMLGRTLSQNSAQPERRGSLEDWQMENKGVLDAEMVRKGAGGSLRRGQLLALRANGAPTLTLASVVWLRVTTSGALRMAARFLCGAPQAVRLRQAGIQSDAREAAGLLLPALSGAPASLIVPRSWFQPGRVIEMGADGKTLQRVKLGFCVESGTDYEQVSFTVM